MAGGAGAREDLGADGDASLRCKIPDYPGEEPLQHLATQWREQRDDALRDAGLIEVAKGGEPPSIRHLQFYEYDLNDYPMLPPSHPHAEKRIEVRNEKYLWRVPARGTLTGPVGGVGVATLRREV